MNLIIIFLTGLTTGGVSCLAMQGGLLASVMANQTQVASKNSSDTPWHSVLSFLVAKLIAHTILGILLGALGSVVSLSLEWRLFFQIAAAFFMFATAMNLLNVHPIFRYVAFQPPKFLSKLVRKTSKSKIAFAPFVLGLMTIFIPCGITQAMEVLAIQSGSPLQGALIMFSFVLGTSPLFAFLGVATAKLSEEWRQRFTKFAAATLIAMALYSTNGVLIVLDSPLSFNKVFSPIAYFFSKERFMRSSEVVPIVAGVQKVTIGIFNQGYKPNYVEVRKGVPVELTLTSNEVYSCALSFIFKEFNIKTFLGATDTQVFRFTPTRSGEFTFTCSMGMYSGVMKVI